MIDFYKYCSKYSINIKRVEYHKDYIIVEADDSKKYLLKEKGNSKELFDYFNRIHYSYYLPLISDLDDSIEIYRYYDEISNDIEIKSKEMISSLISLQNKSFYYEEVGEEEFKKIYDNFHRQITDLMEYYYRLNDFIEEFSFPRIDYYVILKYISKIHNILKFSLERLNSWFELHDLNLRKCFLINNLKIDNYCYSDVSFFIDYKDSNKDLLIYDFVSFYKENNNINILELFEFYNSKINLSKSEMELLFCLICIPEKIDFSNDVYKNSVLIVNTIHYIDKTLEFVSEKYKKYQETPEDKFEEQDENI